MAAAPHLTGDGNGFEDWPADLRRDLVFTTVEFLGTANEPLPLPESPRA